MNNLADVLSCFLHHTAYITSRPKVPRRATATSPMKMPKHHPKHRMTDRLQYCASILLCTLLLPFLSAGCSIYYDVCESRMDYYYLDPYKDLAQIGRVAVVQLDNDSAYPQISADLTQALYEAIQKKQIFGASLVSQQDPDWRSLQIHVGTKQTLEQLCAIRKTLACDAVLLGTITAYEPHPHMVIALRLKIIDLADGNLLWAVEQVWDSADKSTQCRINNYLQRRVKSDLASLRGDLMAVSSLNFIRFVVYEVAETLQPKDKFAIW